MGAGNVGALNAFKHVGKGAGIAVLLFDLAKGAGAVAIALWLLDVSPLFVLAAGLAAVVGHNWSIFLKFTGGKGMATTIGVLAVLMHHYGYWCGVLIFLAIVGIGMAITHNVALSNAIALICLPIIVWLGTKSVPFVSFTVILGLVVGLKTLPSARAAWASSEGIRDFIRGR